MQDINFSETARYADLVLPAAASIEKDGTYTSTERRIQRHQQSLRTARRVQSPTGRSSSSLPTAWAPSGSYTHPSEIMDEIAGLTPLFAGVRYDRLEGYSSLQWPVAADGTDTPLLFTDKFPFPDGKARFFPIEYLPPSEETSSVYDLHLNNGRLLEHFEQGSMTYRTPGIYEITPENFVEVSPELAAERGVSSGSFVHLTSPYGRVKVQALVSDRVRGKQLYMTLNSVEEPVNKLTSSHVDRSTHTPAFKETAVSMTVLPEKGKQPVAAAELPLWHPPATERRRDRTQVGAAWLPPSRNTGER